MNTVQLAGLAIAAALGLAAAIQAAMSSGRQQKPSLDGCARDALSLAGRLRDIGCPEGVSACQALLNVILEHPGHAAKPQPPEVRT